MNVNSRRRSRDRSHEDLKASLRMTPIAAKGETVEQAMLRVSKLKLPKRPNAAEYDGSVPLNIEDRAAL